ncbi:MAG: FtsX-like permease family protein [Armatimonadetes bacterium]|nr:FtsX-like permease family protein [Armatimonadota bacterium]
MGILDAIQTGITELLSHKMRSMLTMLGVIFGVAAVIAMVSIGEGAKQEALDQIKQMGIDVIHVKRASITGELADRAEERSPFGLKSSDARIIKDVCTFARQVVPTREVFADVKAGEKPVSVKIVGTTAGYLDVSKSELQSGRFLRDKDIHDHLAVCVLGAAAKRELFGFDDPMGKMVKANNRLFTVVGLIKPKEVGTAKAFSTMRDLNSDIYIPITVSVTDFNIASQQAIPSDVNMLQRIARKLMSKQSPENASLSEIIIQLDSEDATGPAASIVRSILNRAHRGIRDYEIIIPAELLKQSQATQRIFNIVMAAIAGISLLVGGIGIMNIMLATVTQRTREIGVRRCIGATRWDIVRQFMLEALVITCMGGLIGVVAGIGGAKLISDFAGWRTVVSMQAVIVSFSVSALVGVVFGMYPAVRAAMVDPIEALRYG